MEANNTLDTTFSERRKKFMGPVVLAELIVIVPFVVLHLMAGNYALSASVSLFLMLSIVDAWTVLQDRPVLVPYPYVILVLTLAFFCATKAVGLATVLWSYPAIIAFYFVLPRKTAHIFAVLILLPTTMLIAAEMGFTFAVRVFASQLFTIYIISNILQVTFELQKKLLQQVIRDPLTGVFNRRQMDIVLKEAYLRFQRKQDPVCLLVIDIDEFKYINDHFGHAAGDEILIQFVATVEAHTREIDYFFRTGGDEFLLLFFNTEANVALAVAQALSARIAAATFPIDSAVTVSIGVNKLQSDESIVDWIRGADEALYEAKQAGRNQACLHHAEIS